MSTHSLTMVEAINLALRRAMTECEDVVLLGEDIAANGGVFRATDGLYDEFGYKRVMDTPLAECSIAGLSIGMASQGMRPVAEIQFLGFIFPAIEQLVCHAARMRNRTRGRLLCPLTVRIPFGGGIHAPEHHSESTEAMLAQIPGLRVVVPSSPQRAYSLLLSAIDCNDPVIFLEPKRIYRSTKQLIEDDGRRLPLDMCFTLREGRDVTVVSWGAMIKETIEAADQLAEEGIDVEVVDLASVSPMDRDTIRASVRKTSRLVIVQEAIRSSGVGAEIAADIANHCFAELSGPIKRVTGYDITMPYYRLEHDVMPQTQHIASAVREVMEGL